MTVSSAKDIDIMCRWMAYRGTPLFIDEFLFAPKHSLIDQSRQAQQAKTGVNADGFGIGWYGERPVPGVFRDIMPAWSDENLRTVAYQVKASMFLAHVRASTGTPTSRVNCHPFRHDNLIFVHNGQIGDFCAIRRTLESRLPDRFYSERQGSTDSELIFLMMCANGLKEDPLHATAVTLGQIVEDMRTAGITSALRYTACLADGDNLHAIRYSSDDKPPTLYYAHMETGWLVVSEPFDMECDRWQPVAPNSWVTVTEQGAFVEPFTVKFSKAALATVA